MKAWKIWTDNVDYFDVVFADTRNKARSMGMYSDGFEETPYIYIHATRLPEADKLYHGQRSINWDNPDDRLVMVKDYGCSCGTEFIFDTMGKLCEECIAKEYCDEYIEFYKENREI